MCVKYGNSAGVLEIFRGIHSKLCRCVLHLNHLSIYISPHLTPRTSPSAEYFSFIYLKKNWKWFLLLLSGHSSFNYLFVFCLRMSPQKAHRTGVCRSGMRLLILSSMQPVQKHSGCAWKRFIHDGNNF